MGSAIRHEIVPEIDRNGHRNGHRNIRRNGCRDRATVEPDFGMILEMFLDVTRG